MFPVRTLEPGAKITENGVYAIPIEQHHAQPCDGPSITSSRLRTIFEESPLDYWIRSPLNPNRLPDIEKEAWNVGRALHHLVLGESGFRKRFAIMPDEIASAKGEGSRTKRWAWEKDHAHLTILTPSQFEDIRGMAGVLDWQRPGPDRPAPEDSGLANNQLVKDGILSGLIEVTIAYKDPETGIWLLSRPDAIPLTSTDAVDLKMTDSITLDSLSRTVAEYRYDMQAAMIRYMMRKVLELNVSFSLVFVKRKPPYSVEIRELTDEEVNEGEKDLLAAFRYFAKCLHTARWPGPGGQRRDAAPLSRPHWSRIKAENRRSAIEQEIAAT